MSRIAKQTPKAPKDTIWKRYNTTRQELKASLVERDVEIDIALTALVCQQHVLFVGPPGTAKSLLAESIRKWIAGASSLTVHCCKDTTRNVAFGPIKLSSLKADKTERALEGGAADAEVLILEEVFKAGPAVLDMFLMVMNERVYREGLVAAQCPLRFLLGVSNEWNPEGCEAALSAFFDRFLFRRAVQPIKTQAGIDRLLGMPIVGQSAPVSTTPSLSTSLTVGEVDEAAEQAQRLQFSEEAADCFRDIRLGLLSEGIEPGDRRLKWSVRAAQSSAWLDGSPVVEPEHLQILAHTLWIDPQEQPGKAAKVIGKLANPTGWKIGEMMDEALDVVAKLKPSDAADKLEVLKQRLHDLPANDRKEDALDHLDDLLRETYKRVLKQQS